MACMPTRSITICLKKKKRITLIYVTEVLPSPTAAWEYALSAIQERMYRRRATRVALISDLEPCRRWSNSFESHCSEINIVRENKTSRPIGGEQSENAGSSLSIETWAYRTTQPDLYRWSNWRLQRNNSQTQFFRESEEINLNSIQFNSKIVKLKHI